jgi:hypothetical protein
MQSRLGDVNMNTMPETETLITSGRHLKANTLACYILKF